MADSTARQVPSYITHRVRSAGPPQRAGARTRGCVTFDVIRAEPAVEADSAARGPRSLLR
jgi:hypothetical protein